MPSSEPLFRAQNVRVDDAKGPAIEKLDATTTGACVAFVGAPRSLFAAAAGMRDVTAGELFVAGMHPREALRSGLVASAPADVAVPARWSVEDLAIENARLAGRPRSEARTRAHAAIRALKLDDSARAALGGLDLSVKRAALLCAAIATGAEILVVEDFTVGVADGAARALAKLFVTACENKRWMFFAGRLALSSPIGLNADEALLFAGSRLVTAGLPAEIATRDRTFTLRTSADASNMTAFADKLRARGATVESPHDAALTVTMPEDLSTHELVAIARAEHVLVVELLPMSGALS